MFIRGTWRHLFTMESYFRRWLRGTPYAYILILVSRLRGTLFEWRGVKLWSLLARASFDRCFFPLSLFTSDTNAGQNYRLTHCITNLHRYNLTSLTFKHSLLQKYYTKRHFSCKPIARKCHISYLYTYL